MILSNSFGNGFRRFLPLLLCLTVFAGRAQPRVDKAFFNGRDLTGWSATDVKYWSVKNGTIVGRADQPVDKNKFLWSSVKVADFYLSVDVKLEPDDRNAGIQFRSQKADASGQALGYQADMGQDVWGRLYHEHGRQKLDWSDRGEKAVQRGQWNQYEILAVGDRIWTAINGKLAVAIRDPGGDASGYMALQIHSGEPQTVTYKINQLVHNPNVALAGLNEAELNRQLKMPLDKRRSSAMPVFQSGDVIAFAGGSNIAAMRKDGILETRLYAAFPATRLHIWNLGWDGDTVYEQFRDVGFGSWSKNLDSLGAKVVFVQFGQMESLQGEKSLPHFITAYQTLLDSIRQPDRRLVLLSPIPFEPARLPQTPLGKSENPMNTAPVEQYTEAIRKLAEAEGYGFVDLFHSLRSSDLAGPITVDGIHLTKEGQEQVATQIFKYLNPPVRSLEKLEALNREVRQKNILWFNYWRPSNWAFLNGDRTTQPFSHDWQDKTRRIFPEEMKAFEPLIREAEQRIADEQRKLAPVR
ncbi:family 16 glycoside hydrolase [Larkinella insperata]|uniref:Family 16 glycoside hydrolase n=1 Tax=Larkinella insperata TaxID=332158 RepID=A0ABW3QEN6_9BACT|nr:family 16 glycoside hydrolase [Larkinella insperata]